MEGNNNNNNNNKGDESSSRRNEKGKKGSKRKTLRVASFPQPLPPEVAAQYLSQATAAAAVAWEKNASSAEAKPFGPSRPPSSASVSFGSLDLAALAQSGSLDFAAAAAAANKSSSTGDSSTPCSEAEMKALMSMFVEIMGMSMDADKNNSGNSNSSSSSARSKNVTRAAQSFLASATSNGSNASGTTTAAASGGGSSSSSSFPVFMFGNSSSDRAAKEIPPPPGGWPSSAAAAAAAAAGMCMPRGDGESSSWGVDYYEEEEDSEDEDNDSMPDLEDSKKAEETATAETNEDTLYSPAALAALEQVEAEQEEERQRKAAKKREKKQRKKEKAKKEAALKASQAAQKKREKLALSWRSRVVSACQSNEVAKLQALLSESPLRPPKTHEESTEETNAFIKSHMEYLLPNCIAKTRLDVEKKREARQTLANFIMNWSIALVFTCGRNGRTALHTACFNGDVYFVQLVLERAATARKEDASVLMESYPNVICDDSGFAPLHYAAVSGSSHVIEALLKWCDISTVTDDTRTWRISNGDGITAKELAEIVRSGKHDRILECDGEALNEVKERYLDNSGEKSRYLRVLEKTVDRLNDVERNGYSPPKDPVPSLKGNNDDEQEEDDTSSRLSRRTSSMSEDVAKKKKKKKKKDKQQQQQAESEPAKPAPSVPAPVKKEDPTITALLGMGFTAEQIDAAAKACGGVDRATADDLVMWIFAQESGEEPAAPNEMQNVTSQKEEPEDPEEVPFVDPAAQSERNKEKREQAAAQARQDLLEASKREEEARKAAQRLAAKREEQRRRNREWNNREQARQREEAQAKLTREMERRARAEAQRIAMERAAAQPPQLHTGTNVGVPQQVSYAPAPVVAREPQQQLPQQVMPAPTHVLHSNGKIRPLMQPPRNQHPPQSHNAPAPYPPEFNNNQMPPGPASGMGMDAAQMRSNGPPGYPMAFGQPPRSNSFEYPDHVNGGRAEHVMPVIPPEDATVSSAGSGRPPRMTSGTSTPMGPQGMSRSSSTPPPGFRPPQSTPSPSLSATQYSEEPNHLGEIRATAKAFVPTNFKPMPQAQPLERVTTAPANMSSATPPPGEFSSAPASRIARSTSDVPMGFGGSEPSGADPMLDPVSSLLGGVGSFQSGSSSLLPASSTRLPAALDQSPVASAASSVTGAPVSSSLLDPVNLGGGGGGTSSSVGGIWGSSSSTTAAAPIAGLPSFGFGDGGAATSSLGADPALRSFGTVNGLFGDPNNKDNASGGNTNWGSGDAGNSNGLGSIW